MFGIFVIQVCIILRRYKVETVKNQCPKNHEILNVDIFKPHVLLDIAKPGYVVFIPQEYISVINASHWSVQRLITRLQCRTEFSPSDITKQSILENLFIFINSTEVIRMSTYIFFYYLFCISFLNFEWKIIFVFKLWESKAGLNSV